MDGEYKEGNTHEEAKSNLIYIVATEAVEDSKYSYENDVEYLYMLLILESNDYEYQTSENEAKVEVERNEWCKAKRRKDDLFYHLGKVKQRCDEKDLSEFNDIVSQLSIDVLYFFILVVEIQCEPVEDR